MTYVFMDESGDMGFDKRSSRYFLFTLAIIEDQRVLERVVKKVWKIVHKKHKHVGELHASHEKVEIKYKMFQLLSEIKDLKIVTIVLNKNKVHSNLQSKKNYLYNYTANIVLDRLINTKIINKDKYIYLVVDRKDTKKNLQENFISYITEGMNIRQYNNFRMSLVASHEDKGLQAVDFISWAIFRKYEMNDCDFYDKIKDKIIEEKPLF